MDCSIIPPVAYNDRIYIASRDGYLYCFGDTSTTNNEIQKSEVIEVQEIAVVEEKEIEPLVIEKIKVPENKIEPIIKYLTYINQRIELNKSIPSYNEKIISLVCEGIEKHTHNIVNDEIVETSAKKKYHLITGSFTIKENAVKFCAKLKSQGFEASMFGPKGGFYFVSLVSFSSRDKATESLPKALNEGYKDAWVMKY